MLRYIYVLLIALCSGQCIAQDSFMDDDAFYKHFNQELRRIYDSENCVSLKLLSEQLDRKECKTSFESNFLLKGNESLYSKVKKSVLVVGRLFQTKNSNTDRVYVASGFVISEDGICVTNHHVFELDGRFNNLAMGVMDSEGNVYPIKEVLASKEHDDIAIFKIDTKGKKMSALKLSENASVGENIHVIGHPRNMFYKYTKGVVSRKYIYKKEKSERMSITADFAVGSSGGPILNDMGEVIGVVSSTFPIPSKKMVQMVVKEIIPVSSLKKLIKR